MKNPAPILCLILISTLATSLAFAGIEPPYSNKLDTILAAGDTVSAWDDKFSSYPPASCGFTDYGTGFVYVKSDAYVILKIKEDTASYPEDSFKCFVAYQATGYDSNCVSHVYSDTLEVSYFRGANRKHIDQALNKYENIHYIKAEIVSVTFEYGTPVELVFEARVNVERYFYFDESLYPSFNSSTFLNTGELLLDWTIVGGAEEYDLEWLHVNNLDYNFGTGSVTSISASDLSFDFRHNSSRVTVKENSYKIPAIVERGYILYRVRAVGVFEDNVRARKEGDWSSATQYGNVNAFSDRDYISAGHEDSLNWQYVISFAESGKRKFVINYFDGSLRNRQSITQLSTGDSTVVVGETIYDHQGRPAVNILPVPAFNSRIKYYEDFNIHNNVSYSRLHFDTTSCSQKIADPLDTSSGASKYYSAAQPDPDSANNFQSYVADAGGYPFTQVEYTPDMTGRIRRQSGVGDNHYLGSGHETKYWYGKPHQIELDMLFGSEAGYASHYKKNMVMDPNGQLSISYMDLTGNVIATALAGDTTNNLNALDSFKSPVYITENLLDTPFNISIDNALISSSTYLVTSPGVHTFTYKIIAPKFSDPCLDEAICYECKYDLTFKVTDDCGNSLIDTLITNINPLDTICQTDSLYFVRELYLEIGNYMITKKLAVNDSAANFYVNHAMQANTCLQSYDDFLEEEIGRLDFSGCDSDTSTDIFDECEIFYNRMLQDVSLGGQYLPYPDPDGYAMYNDPFSFLNESNSFSGENIDWRHPVSPYLDVNGEESMIALPDGSEVRPEDLPFVSQFVENWQPTWAYSLISYHPEYCYWNTWCSQMEASREFDKKLNLTGTWDQAVDSAYFTDLIDDDPFFNTSIGSGYKTSMKNDTADVRRIANPGYTSTFGAMTITQFVTTAVNCGDNYTDFSLCMTNFYFGKDVLSRDALWEAYRAMYFALKYEYVTQSRLASACSVSVPTGKTPRFIAKDDVFPIDITDTLENKELVLDSASSHCDNICEINADYWIAQLDSCNVSADTLDSLKLHFIELCKTGCGLDEPFGVSVLPENETDIYGYHSFEEILDSFVETTSRCNHYLISMPKPADHYYFSGKLRPTDDCFCDYLSYACYKYDERDSTCTAPVLQQEALDLQALLNKLIDEDLFLNFNNSPNDQVNLLDAPFSTIYNPTLSGYFYTSDPGEGQIYVGEKMGDGTYVGDITESFNTVTINLEFVNSSEDFDDVDSFTSIQEDLTYHTANGGINQNFLMWAHIGGDSFLVSGYSPYPISSYSCISSFVNHVKYNNSFTAFFNDLYGVQVSDKEMILFRNKCFCDTPNTDLIRLGIMAPRKLMCPPCIACDTLTKAIDHFNTDIYAGLVGSGKFYYKMLGNYLNGIFSNNLAYYDYLDFYSECTDNEKTVQEILALELCHRDLFPTVSYDTSKCRDRLMLYAQANAQERYNNYIDSARNSIRNKYIALCLGSATELYQMEYLFQEYHYTLYYYDQARNLIKTVPPKGVKPYSSSTARQVADHRENGTLMQPGHELASRYQYNTLGGVIGQSTPDGGETDFYYDELGRIVASQNDKQRPDDFYSYTLYDEQGRVVESGQTFATVSDLGPSFKIDYSDFEFWMMSNVNSQISRTYYDVAKDAATSNAFGAEGQQNLRGRVASAVYLDETPGGSIGPLYATHYSYDIHGNVNVMLQENALMSEYGLQEFRYKRMEYFYDLISGNVNEVWYQDGEPDRFYHRYTYDADNRITAAYTSPDKEIWDRDGKYFYYLHGPLARVEIGEQKVQGMDYAYTVHGWLKSVNRVGLKAWKDMGQDGIADTVHMHHRVARDAMAFMLGYYDGDYSRIHPDSVASVEPDHNSSDFGTYTRNLYNGNINNMIYSNGSLMPGTIGYGYHYDQLNRLIEMKAFDNYDAANFRWDNGTNSTYPFSSGYTYDPNGNIKILIRKAVDNGTVKVMDNLAYNYTSGKNQLEYVTDGGVTDFDNDLRTQPTDNYEYDEIGNLVKDSSEEISQITWSVSGKVLSVIRQDGSSKPNLEFAYDAMGQRVMKKVSNGSAAHRATYEYYARDAQGNIMAVYGRNTSDSVFDVNHKHVLDTLAAIVGTSAYESFLINHFKNEPVFMDSLIANLSRQSNFKLILDHYPDISFLCSTSAIKNHVLNYYNWVDLYAQYDPSYLIGMISSTGGFQALTENYLNYAGGYLDQLYAINPSIIVNLYNTYFPGGPCPPWDTYCMLNEVRTLSANTIAFYIVTNGYSGYAESAMYGMGSSTLISMILQSWTYGTVEGWIISDKTECGVFNDILGWNKSLITNALVSYSDIPALLELVFNDDDDEFMDIIITYFMPIMFEEITEYYTLAELLDEIEDDFTSGQYDELIERLGLNGTLYVTESYHLKEHPMYGSSRLGIYKHDSVTLKWFHYKGIFDQEEGTLSDITYLDSGTTATDTIHFMRCRGQRLYELTNHLGNVLAVVTDRKLPVDSSANGRIDYYMADVIRATDYYPFGSTLPGRTFSSASYTYGFNGMMKDDEWKGDGNSYDFGARIYDPRIGRWFSPDPKAAVTPGHNPYNFCFNNPIILVDPDGETGIASIKGNKVIIRQNYYLYGDNLTKKEARQIARKIQKEYNSAHGHTTINGKRYKVKFKIKGYVIDKDEVRDRMKEAKFEDNFVAISDADGMSHTDGNTGWWSRKQNENFGGTTFLHEPIHGLGMVGHPSDEGAKTDNDDNPAMRLPSDATINGQPIDPAKRKFQQSDIDIFNIEDAILNNEGKLGHKDSLEIVYDSDGTPHTNEKGLPTPEEFFRNIPREEKK